MPKFKEFDFSFKDARGRSATHRVRVFICDSWTTIIATDRTIKYNCASVTNTIDQLVNALIVKEKLDPERVVVIEHYDDLEKETYDLVQFERMPDGSFRFPSWKAINEEEAHHWAGLEVPA